MGIHFDPTINIGTILTVVAGVFVAFKIYSGIMTRIDRLETRMDPVWNWFTTELNDMRLTGIAIEKKRKP